LTPENLRVKTDFMFRDRIEAGQLLVDKLRKYKNDDAVILAVPRGGVPVAYPVARELDLPLELILAKKIGHPLNKEYAIGAASLDDYFIIQHENISDEYIREEVKRVRVMLNDMCSKFESNCEPESFKGKSIIVIDDGIATGNTLMATVELLRKKNPRKIVIAVPVASYNAWQKLSEQVNELVSLIVPEEFYGVGSFYENFDQVSNEEVIFYLNRIKQLRHTD
jgi:predicted phosphoribosyltransferase